VLGALSFWPVTYACGFTTGLVDAMRVAAKLPPLFGPRDAAYLVPAIGLYVVSLFVALAVVVACWVHLASNDELEPGLRLPIALLLVIAGPVVAPAYWWWQVVESRADRVRALKP